MYFFRNQKRYINITYILKFWINNAQNHMHSLGREYFYRLLSISRRETTVLWVKLVFVVSVVAISYCIIIIAHLHGLYCAFGQALLHLCSPQWVSDVIMLPWRKRGSLFRPSYAYDKRFVLHVAYIYLRVINAPYVGETRILYIYIHRDTACSLFSITLPPDKSLLCHTEFISDDFRIFIFLSRTSG